ncbi:MAG TPA: DMT family transporter [Gemmataceae bacterium]|nr:DMT family transporter [Gemmataceae bacterium]
MSQPVSEDRVLQLTQEDASVHSAPRPDRKATWMLVLITSMWGLSFTLMKNWQDAAEGCPGGVVVAGLTMVALRMFLALVVLGVFLPRLFRDPTRREFTIGLLLGGINSLGFVFQVTGLAWTSPALSAFVTSLASAWVPLLMLALFRLPVHRLTLAGLMIGIAGAGVLGIQTSLELTFGWGEMLTFISTWFFALMIVLLDRLGRGVESAHFTVAFLAGTGIPALLINGVILVDRNETASWINWTTTMLSNPLIWRDLILLTLLCTVLPFHWFNVYQPRVAASRAAVIYLLEPVFASIISIAWGHDVISPRLILGGSLILAGNALVEVPAWFRTFKPPV